LNARYRRFLRTCTLYSTSSESLDEELILRSALDLRALIDDEDTGLFVTAGIPWYAVPFGRDGLIAAYQTLAWNPDIARGTLRLLARYQGTKIDAFTEEAPGKIFHELRRGELARLGEVPHRPYYGTVDATPLFAMLFAETVKWTGDRALWRELLPNAERALTWCDTFGDADGDGYVEYGASPSDLRNHGWKDSANALSDPNGQPSALPAALVEAQAYVYAAKRGLADLYAIDGETERAATLRAEAASLAERFERDFWMENEGCYAQALDGNKKQVPAVTSNAGHALWAGIARPDRARRVVERLMAPDMFSGWGVRTLSSTYTTYNPMSYHNGSVWPHDNSLIAQGFVRYGFREEANAIVEALIEAGKRFPNARLPELFCGFQRDLRFSSRPADYLVSCIPQAWSAGMVFLCLRSLLGLEPDLERRRVIVDPALPVWLDRIEVQHLRAYDSLISFRVRRSGRSVTVTGGGSRVARASTPAIA
jgi:glycogen debranching enzyme